MAPQGYLPQSELPGATATSSHVGTPVSGLGEFGGFVSPAFGRAISAPEAPVQMQFEVRRSGSATTVSVEPSPALKESPTMLAAIRQAMPWLHRAPGCIDSGQDGDMFLSFYQPSDEVSPGESANVVRMAVANGKIMAAWSQKLDLQLLPDEAGLAGVDLSQPMNPSAASQAAAAMQLPGDFTLGGQLPSQLLPEVPGAETYSNSAFDLSGEPPHDWLEGFLDSLPGANAGFEAPQAAEHRVPLLSSPRDFQNPAPGALNLTSSSAADSIAVRLRARDPKFGRDPRIFNEFLGDLARHGGGVSWPEFKQKSEEEQDRYFSAAIGRKVAKNAPEVVWRAMRALSEAERDYWKWIDAVLETYPRLETEKPIDHALRLIEIGRRGGVQIFNEPVQPTLSTLACLSGVDEIGLKETLEVRELRKPEFGGILQQVPRREGMDDAGYALALWWESFKGNIAIDGRALAVNELCALSNLPFETARRDPSLQPLPPRLRKFAESFPPEAQETQAVYLRRLIDRNKSLGAGQSSNLLTSEQMAELTRIPLMEVNQVLRQ